MALSRIARYLVPLAAAALLWACSAPGPSPLPQASRQASFDAAAVRKGARLAAVGNCVSCHTAPEGKAYAGGYPVRTPFGVVHGSNITPDAETGIGNWSLQDFTRALREGVSPEGHHYYPAFPYEFFTRLDDGDVAALYAFFMTRTPVRHETPGNTMLVPRFAIGFWKSRYFHPGRWSADPSHDAAWNRGAYLAESLAHCSACHTPRDKLGGLRRERYMAGGEVDGWHAPALDRDSPSPTPWDVRALSLYLSTGLVDRHAITAGPMAPVVRNLAHASREDIGALAVYVTSLMEGARGSAAASPALSADAAVARGARLYSGSCADCHDRGRAAEGGALQLPLAIALSLPTPANLIHIVRGGIAPREHEAQPWMPSFEGALTPRQIADLVAYLRTLSGKPAWADVAGEVRKAQRGDP